MGINIKNIVVKHKKSIVSCFLPLTTKMLETSVLLLNYDQSPLNIISMRRALSLMRKNKVYYEENHTSILKFVSSRETIKIPRILILKYYVKTPNKKCFPSKKNILKRDKYVCQYCHIELTDKSATVDHIIPRHKGGGSTWVNMVACCRECNLYKGSKLPKEANMILETTPKEPKRNFIFEDSIKFFMRTN